MKRSMKRSIIIIGIIIVTLLLYFLLKKDDGNTIITEGLSDNMYEETYLTYLEKHGFKGSYATDSIHVDLTNYKATPDMEVQLDGTTLKTSDEGTITWEFEVKEEGFYNLQLGYIPMEGTGSDIQRKIWIDGEIAYEGLTQIVLKRGFQDEPIKMKNKNEIRPSAVEVFEERIVYIEDYQRRNGEPFILYLEKGKHNIGFEVIKEPMQYTSLTFHRGEELLTYDEYIKVVGGIYKKFSGDKIVAQAERMEGITLGITKSSNSINVQKNYSDSNVVPYHPYRIRYNTIGSNSFAMPGDFITWTVEVEEEGLYELTFKGRQHVNRGVTSYRKILVNGVVPFDDMLAYSFDYSSDMTYYTLEDKENKPYLFYLKEGNNHITMEVVLGDFGRVLTEVEKSMKELNSIYLKTIQITGQSPSKFIDYEIARKIPQFTQVMKDESERLHRICDELFYIIGEKGENTALIEKTAIQAGELAKKPEQVINELNPLKNNIAALGTWIVKISSMPLELDSLVLSAQGENLGSPKDNILASTYYGVIRFFSTFVVKQSDLASEDVKTVASKGKDEVLTVWMAAAGKEQAQILQNMIDETFIPNYNINVELKLIPLDVVLRAALTGDGPDVVVGVSQATIADFAMRNALIDISKLEGFEQERTRFFDSAMEGASYLDGVYGIPEQQTFMMLFCRNDILNEIGANVPKTWDEVKDILPLLQKHNYSFFIPKADVYTSMLYQRGGDLYLGEGMDYGISSALSSNIAMDTFKYLTDFFTSYKLPVNVDFNNRFRTGEIPIGVAEYTMYNNLEIFAPEIKGLWSFSQFPGFLREDGTIDNTYVTGSIQSVIMKNADNVDDAWTFLKWWTGTEAQLQYATTIESIMGTSARYTPADKEVLKQLSWSNRDVSELLQQLEHTKGIPAIPGSYMTSRMIGYAFDDVTANSSNPREILFLNMKAIDKELTKKRMEFGLSYTNKSY